MQVAQGQEAAGVQEDVVEGAVFALERLATTLQRVLRLQPSLMWMQQLLMQVVVRVWVWPRSILVPCLKSSQSRFRPQALSFVFQTEETPLSFVEVAVRALGQLVENTGCVIIPYLDHPSLLGDLLDALQRSSGAGASSTASGGLSVSQGTQNRHWPVRREIMRLLGILGALDPYRHRMACIAAAQRAALSVQVR